MIGIISTENSTTSTLGGAGVFTGTAEEVQNYGACIINVLSDKDSAANGLSIQFSSDSTNWDHILTFTVLANVAQALTIPPRARYFRIVYTNGGVAQTAFRLQTIFQTEATSGPFPPAQPLGDDPNPTTVLVGSCIKIWDAIAAEWVMVRASNSVSDGSDGSSMLPNGNRNWNGSGWEKERGITSAAGAVTGTGIAAAGMIGSDSGGTYRLVQTDTDRRVLVVGSVAHDAVDAGNPQKIGFKAIAHGANPSAVAANDRTDWYSNRHGIPFMIGGHPNTISHAVQYTAAQTDAAIITVSSGTKIIVTRLLVTNDNSTSVDVSVRIGFGTANVPAYGNAGIVGSHPGLSAGGGFSTGDGSGIIGIGADGEDLRITCSVPTGGAIDCVVSYFTCES